MKGIMVKKLLKHKVSMILTGVVCVVAIAIIGFSGQQVQATYTDRDWDHSGHTDTTKTDSGWADEDGIPTRYLSFCDQCEHGMICERKYDDRTEYYDLIEEYTFKIVNSNGVAVYYNALGNEIARPSTMNDDDTITHYDTNKNVITYAVYQANTTYDEEEEGYRDVSKDSWCYTPVTRGTELGLIHGVGNGYFSPNSKLTRSQLGQMLYNYFVTDADDQALWDGSKNMTGLSDVSSGQWWTAAANWSYKNDIITGVNTSSGKKFLPFDAPTREQVCVIIARAAKKFCGADITNVDKTKMNELKKNGNGNVSAWAEDAVAWCINNGIMTGTSDKYLNPSGEVTRAEAVTMLVRAIDGNYLHK